MKLWIVQTFFDMECERQKFVIVLADGFIIDFHIVENGLFVAEVIVVLHLGTQLVMGRDILPSPLFFLVLLATSYNTTILGRAVVLWPSSIFEL